MARGDKALAGEEEKDIPGHLFPPDSSKDRTIYFRGLYLSIVNKDTNDVKTHIDNTTATTLYEAYEIPAGYTCYVRGASVYFKT
ncbi:hypothetical protein KJE20_14290 [Pyrenophora tritici-repentis]|nr:hypothetical protein KJE20_14290 [Pyrenophora tritici-repentis]